MGIYSNMWGNFGLFSCLIRLNWGFVWDGPNFHLFNVCFKMPNIGLCNLCFREVLFPLIIVFNFVGLKLGGKALILTAKKKRVCNCYFTFYFILFFIFDKLLHMVDVIASKSIFTLAFFFPRLSWGAIEIALCSYG